MWVVVSVSGIVLLLILLLCIPVDLTFFLEKEARTRSRIRVSWLFGLVGSDLGGKQRKPGPEQPRERQRKGGFRPVLALLRTRGFPERSFKLGWRVLRTVKVKELELHAQLGLGDPADTGQLFGVIGPALAFAAVATPFDITVDPDFQEEKLRGYCQGAIRVFPIQWVGPLLLFVCSPATFRGVKALLKARRR